MTQPPDKSPFEHLTNAQVVDEHRRRGPADTIYVSEMLLRLMWLLLFTIAIFALTSVLPGAELVRWFTHR